MVEETILTKEQLLEICGSDIKLDPEVETILQTVAQQYFKNIVELSAEAATSRRSEKLEADDIEFCIENYIEPNVSK